MDPERLSQIHKALEQTNGDRKMAAVLLQIDPVALKDTINNNAPLRARWSKSRRNGDTLAVPVTEAQSITKPPEVVEALAITDEPVTSEERQIAVAFDNEDKMVRSGVSLLRLTPEEEVVARELAQYQQGNFFESISILAAGVVRVSIKILTQIDAVSGRLAEVRGMLPGTGGEAREALVGEEHKLHEAFVSLTDQVRKIREMADRSALIHAKIRFGMQEKKRGKPEFTDASKTRESIGANG